jgi:hypothetical protein
VLITNKGVFWRFDKESSKCDNLEQLGTDYVNTITPAEFKFKIADSKVAN